MKLREWINRNSELTTIISVFLLVFSLIVLVKSMPKGGREITHGYYYDVVTGKLFSGSIKDVPPVDTPDRSFKNGVPAGVRANVFTCGSCAEEKERWIGYLETCTQEAREALEAQRAIVDANVRTSEGDMREQAVAQTLPDDTEMRLMDAITRGRLVALPSDVEKWYSIESVEGSEIVHKVTQKCSEGKYPTQCYPSE